MPFAAKNLRPYVAEIHCMRFFILHTFSANVVLRKQDAARLWQTKTDAFSVQCKAFSVQCKALVVHHAPTFYYITPAGHHFLVTKLVLFCGLPQFLRIKKFFISIKARLSARSQNALRKRRYCAVLPCTEPSLPSSLYPPPTSCTIFVLAASFSEPLSAVILSYRTNFH